MSFNAQSGSVTIPKSLLYSAYASSSYKPHSRFSNRQNYYYPQYKLRNLPLPILQFRNGLCGPLTESKYP